jgi:thiamine-phosphate pyrophosphorylase
MRPGRLHVITDTQLQTRLGHVELARLALEGGATTIQLREKRADTRELVAVAREIGALCRRRRVPFLVNDRADVAWASDADGVHLGADDLSVSDARRLLGPHRIIGASADSTEEAIERARAGADYAGIGPIFATTSKPNTGPVLGIEGLRRAVAGSSIPLIAIGGISLANLDEVLATGVYGVALLGAICLSDDPASAVRQAAARFAPRASTLA